MSDSESFNSAEEYYSSTEVNSDSSFDPPAEIDIIGLHNQYIDPGDSNYHTHLQFWQESLISFQEAIVWEDMQTNESEDEDVTEEQSSNAQLNNSIQIIDGYEGDNEADNTDEDDDREE